MLLIVLLAALVVATSVAVLVAASATVAGPRTMDPAASWRQGS